MTNPTSPVSVCCHCQHYLPEGRRGGHCRQLSAPVQSQWPSCSLSRPVFATEPTPLTSVRQTRASTLTTQAAAVPTLFHLYPAANRPTPETSTGYIWTEKSRMEKLLEQSS